MVGDEEHAGELMENQRALKTDIDGLRTGSLVAFSDIHQKFEDAGEN
jgi:hypothetical protein